MSERVAHDGREQGASAPRRLVPRGLLARAGLIILLPYLSLQALLLITFWFWHWQPLTGRLANVMIDELGLLIASHEQNAPVQSLGEATDIFENLGALQNLGIVAVSLPGPLDPTLDRRARFSTLDAQLRQGMERTFPGQAFSVDTVTSERVVAIGLEGLSQAGPRHYRFRVRKSRLFSDTGQSFLYLILVGGFLVLVPSFLFLRGLVRPIRNLAREATAYGRGATIQEGPVGGATEVRQATLAFRDMRARITRAIDQRTNMLSGVSHDLRTPLTRLKLQLALLEDGPDKEGLSADITEMEAMLQGYLEYARGNVQEEDRLILLSDLVQQTADPKKWPSLNISMTVLSDVAVKGRYTDLVRLLNNLLSNAQRHAANAWVEVDRSRRVAKIRVHDDGPGIDAADLERVLQPFQRLDDSRNLDAAGVGLGLTVVEDIARGHGGSVDLAAGPHGGLQVTVSIPV